MNFFRNTYLNTKHTFNLYLVNYLYNNLVNAFLFLVPVHFGSQVFTFLVKLATIYITTFLELKISIKKADTINESTLYQCAFTASDLESC